MATGSSQNSSKATVAKPTAKNSTNPVFKTDDPSFPLNAEYGYRLACGGCFHGGKLKTLPLPEHQCLQNILILRHKKSHQLFRVRERKNHVYFFGKYKLCTEFAKLKSCPRSDNCSFAHSQPELDLWALEKDGKFGISEFMLNVSTRESAAAGQSLQRFLSQFPGELMFVCRHCFVSDHCLTYQSCIRIGFCGRNKHPWKTSSTLAHRSPGGVIELIGQRPTNVAIKFFVLCGMLQYCQERWTSGCPKAHSHIEQLLWYVQRDSNMTEQDIVSQVDVSCCSFVVGIVLVLLLRFSSSA